ncbi:unnamed protein product [Discosporangium mesarthrocarpum]
MAKEFTPAASTVIASRTASPVLSSDPSVAHDRQPLSAGMSAAHPPKGFLAVVKNTTVNSTAEMYSCQDIHQPQQRQLSRLGTFCMQNGQIQIPLHSQVQVHEKSQLLREDQDMDATSGWPLPRAGMHVTPGAVITSTTGLHKQAHRQSVRELPPGLSPRHLPSHTGVQSQVLYGHGNGKGRPRNPVIGQGRGTKPAGTNRVGTAGFGYNPLHQSGQRPMSYYNHPKGISHSVDQHGQEVHHHHMRARSQQAIQMKNQSRGNSRARNHLRQPPPNPGQVNSQIVGLPPSRDGNKCTQGHAKTPTKVPTRSRDRNAESNLGFKLCSPAAAVTSAQKATKEAMEQSSGGELLESAHPQVEQRSRNSHKEASSTSGHTLVSGPKNEQCHEVLDKQLEPKRTDLDETSKADTPYSQIQQGLGHRGDVSDRITQKDKEREKARNRRKEDKACRTVVKEKGQTDSSARARSCLRWSNVRRWCGELQSLAVEMVAALAFPLLRGLMWHLDRLCLMRRIVTLVSTVTSFAVCWLGLTVAGLAWVLLLFLRLHALAIREAAGSIHVAVCFLVPYCFQYLVSLVDEWAPHWLPACLWYSFLMQVFCTSNHLYEHPLSSHIVPALKVLLPVAFLCEVPSGRSYVLDLGGSELLVLSFALAAIRLRCLFSPVFLVSWALQVVAVCTVGSSPSLQYVQLLVSLASLHAVSMVDMMVNGHLYHARYRAGMRLTSGFRTVPPSLHKICDNCPF